MMVLYLFNPMMFLTSMMWLFGTVVEGFSPSLIIESQQQTTTTTTTTLRTSTRSAITSRNMKQMRRIHHRLFASSTSSSESESSSSSSSSYDDEKMPFYALGANFALQVEQLNLLEVLSQDEIDVVLDGFRDNLRGDVEPLQAQQILMTYGNDLNEILAKRRSSNAQGAKDEGKEFAAKFLKDNPDAIQTPTGLIYLETREGDGTSPTMESTVQVHYHGMLADDSGTVVDSSYDRGEPFTFKCSSAIKGWSEGLLMMKEGGKATLVIPSDIGYGDEGSGAGVIPAGASLKFEVELLKVESPLQQEEEETEILELPDGTQLRVPKGVKMKVVDQEDSSDDDDDNNNSDSEGKDSKDDEDENWRRIA